MGRSLGDGPGGMVGCLEIRGGEPAGPLLRTDAQGCTHAQGQGCKGPGNPSTARGPL
jgi:hypothetical protein